MKTRNGAIVALLALATCSEQSPDPGSSSVESATRRLGKVPGTEVAVWQKIGSNTTPDARYLQAATFDSRSPTGSPFLRTKVLSSKKNMPTTSTP